tara:strand:+ start:57 stop:551 length:495 start_codon:yes stop_codon:yes gene_type:complete
VNKSSNQYQELVNSIKDRYNATYLGAGDNGVALELPSGKVIKVTTDSVELEHAETLKDTSSDAIIPIEKVKIISKDLGYIIMANANKLTPEEETLIKDTREDAESYLLDGDRDALNSIKDNVKLLNLITGIEKAYQSTGMDIEEIDYSADNIMNYNNKFVMVDL